MLEITRMLVHTLALTHNTIHNLHSNINWEFTFVAHSNTLAHTYNNSDNKYTITGHTFTHRNNDDTNNNHNIRALKVM